ncbi:MAG: hypothetical protein KIT80_18200 [Chitinophagaceae bacterium]|nr:hypothetical protein [Chitinophagaceae bacterium]MCW5928858.1 hypothetical protein [Chitinophagaceae bacterium]
MYTSIIMRFLVVVITCMAILNTAAGQKIYHSIGINGSFTNSKEAVFPYLGASYTPRINFYEKPGFSISGTLPVTLGVPLLSYLLPYQGAIINIPAVANFSWGGGSAPGNKQKTGYFFGGGDGYHYQLVNQYTGISSSNMATLTPISSLAATANAGFRISLGRRKQKYLELRHSITMPINNRPNYGFHVLMTNFK